MAGFWNVWPPCQEPRNFPGAAGRARSALYRPLTPDRGERLRPTEVEVKMRRESEYHGIKRAGWLLLNWLSEIH